ncbi:MAG: hypothetical protein ACRDVK_08925 [Acidimicrobiia bacterium]
MAALLLGCSTAQLETTPPATSTTASLQREVADTTTSLARPTTTTTPSLVDQLRGTRIDPIPSLLDGRPATFLGVTRDHAAVEVGTQNGEMVRPIAQIATAADVANAECAACVNAVDQVWRLADGSAFLVSECCEPASGHMFWLLQDAEPVTPEKGEPDRGGLQAWAAAPAPGAPFVAGSSYYLTIASPEDPLIWIASEDFLASGPPAWSWDLARLYVFEDDVLPDNDGMTLRTIDIEANTSDPFALAWWPPESYSSGLAMSAEGNLITFVLTRDDDNFENDPATGVVFKPDGQRIRDFPVEAGSTLGGFDPTGTFLIYVDGEGVVRWHDTWARLGVLGHGFYTASW